MEDRRAHQQKLATGKGKRTPAGKGTGEALAAEAAPEYEVREQLTGNSEE
jgi:hypothetical protein